MEVSNNSFANGVSFNDIYPNTWKFASLRTDIPYIPAINTKDWDVYQSVQIFCHGNSMFELSGSVKKKSGSTSNLLLTGMPYYFTSETLRFNYLVSQTIDGAGGVKKMARVEVRNLQDIRVYTDDITDTNPINLNGIKWCTRK